MSAVCLAVCGAAPLLGPSADELPYDASIVGLADSNNPFSWTYSKCKALLAFAGDRFLDFTGAKVASNVNVRPFLQARRHGEGSRLGSPAVRIAKLDRAFDANASIDAKSATRPKQVTRCQSAWDSHSPWESFQDRLVSEKTV
jgi:hypothetical protein